MIIVYGILLCLLIGGLLVLPGLHRIDVEIQKGKDALPRVKSSDFYKEIVQYLRTLFPTLEKQICETSDDYPCFQIENSGISLMGWDWDSASYWPNDEFHYTKHGYDNLTNPQLYALAKTLGNEFEFLELRIDDKPCDDSELQSAIFEKYVGKIRLCPTEKYIKSIVGSRNTMKSTYKNAF